MIIIFRNPPTISASACEDFACAFREYVAILLYFQFSAARGLRTLIPWQQARDRATTDAWGLGFFDLNLFLLIPHYATTTFPVEVRQAS